MIYTQTISIPWNECFLSVIWVRMWKKEKYWLYLKRAIHLFLSLVSAPHFFCSLLCCYCCIIQRRTKTIQSLRACVLCIRGRACFARLQQMSISLSLAGAKWLFRCMILQGVFPLQSAEAAINARGHIWLLDSRGSSCHTTMLDLAGIYCESLCVCVCPCVCLPISNTVVEACKYSSQLPPSSSCVAEAAGS